MPCVILRRRLDWQLLSTASALKWYNKVNEGNTAKLQEWHPLEGETVGMIFQKRSTRTRVSTEVR